MAELLRQLLDARGGVHGVADHGVLVPVVGADVTEHRLADVQADADGDRLDVALAQARVQALEPREHLARRGDCCRCGAGERLRRAKETHHAVADELVDGAAVAMHALRHLAEVTVQRLDQRFGRHELAARGEVADVGKEDADALPLAREARADAAGEDLVHDLRADVAAEGVAQRRALACVRDRVVHEAPADRYGGRHHRPRRLEEPAALQQD